MKTCGFYGEVLKTSQGSHCNNAGGREDGATYLTVWTGVRTPFWQICPGRRGLSGDEPASLEGYSLAHSSHLPLKCWKPAGERQVGGVLPRVGPPPSALPSLSPSGNGCLCCSLQDIITKRETKFISHLCICIISLYWALHTNHKCKTCTMYQADSARARVYVHSLPLRSLRILL